jgi:glutaredoxin
MRLNTSQGRINKNLGSTGVPYLIVKGHHMKGGFDSDEFLVAMRQPQK